MVMRINYLGCLQIVLCPQWRDVLRCLAPLYVANLLRFFIVLDIRCIGKAYLIIKRNKFIIQLL